MAKVMKGKQWRQSRQGTYMKISRLPKDQREKVSKNLQQQRWTWRKWKYINWNVNIEIISAKNKRDIWIESGGYTWLESINLWVS